MVRFTFKGAALCSSTLLIVLLNNQVTAETQEDGRFWFNLSAQGHLPVEKWNWQLDLQPRFRDEGAHLDQLYIRPAVFYQIDPKTSIWLGYDHVVNHPAGKETVDENRLWQQFSYKFDPIESVTFYSRSRLEERRRENGDETGYRFRQMLKASLPLPVNPSLSLIAYDELFINLNETDWGTQRGIDQNRAFVGINWAVKSDVSLETGYLNQFINTHTIDKENHVLATTLKLNF